MSIATRINAVIARVNIAHIATLTIEDAFDVLNPGTLDTAAMRDVYAAVASTFGITKEDALRYWSAAFNSPAAREGLTGNIEGGPWIVGAMMAAADTVLDASDAEEYGPSYSEAAARYIEN